MPPGGPPREEEIETRQMEDWPLEQARKGRPRGRRRRLAVWATLVGLVVLAGIGGAWTLMKMRSSAAKASAAQPPLPTPMPMASTAIPRTTAVTA